MILTKLCFPTLIYLIFFITHALIEMNNNNTKEHASNYFRNSYNTGIRIVMYKRIKYYFMDYCIYTIYFLYIYDIYNLLCIILMLKCNLKQYLVNYYLKII